MADLPQRLAGALSDRYRLERELGAGGMATVYLAEDLKHRRMVAVKVLRPELGAVLGAERFLSEIKTTANLQHPHILPLFDSGAADGFLFYVMPFVEGESLRDRLQRDKQLPIGESVRIAIEVASALDYAHRHGVVHRDIKPENILLHDGAALVADFGIALAASNAGGARITETGLSLGTPLYMSPEQAMGERDIAAPSDVYSLGCVLYEMLAGDPPFTGSTAQSIAARKLAQSVPSLRTVRKAVPEALEQTVEKALATVPADRFTTAREFAEALDGGAAATVPPSPARLTRRRQLMSAIAILAVLFIATMGVIRWRGDKTPALDPTLIAITPFNVLDPALEVWGEGVVDLLSRTLDGAGSLRTVSPSVVVRGWKGRSDRASATVVARRAGAGLAAIGSLSPRGTDSVDIRATLLDISLGSVIGEVEVSGVTTRVGELVDSLGLELLRALARDRPVAAVRQATIGASPLPALKAFLRGEQWYRRGLFDSALVSYSVAIAGDSGFTMAYYRMAEVLAWNPSMAHAYVDSDFYITQAHTRNHGLSTRDSLLIAANSAWVAAPTSGPAFYRLSLSRMTELVQRYPGDPMAWYALGEMLYHADVVDAVPDFPKALEAFDRAIQLDSAFAPAWEHVFPLALRVGGDERALRYARAGTVLSNTTDATIAMELVRQLLLDTTGQRGPQSARALDSARVISLFRAAFEYFLWLPDSTETAVTLLRELDGRKVPEGETWPHVVDSLMRHQYLAHALAQRGHLREAYQVNHRLITDPAASPWSLFLDPFLSLALLGAIPIDEAERAFAPGLQVGLQVNSGIPRSLSGLPWWAMKQDTSALLRFGQRMRRAGARADTPADRMRAKYLQEASEGYLALVRGDSVAAVQRFTALPDSVCAVVHCLYERLTLASLLSAFGEDARAAAALDSVISRDNRAGVVLARLERGKIAERLGDRETAIRSYQFLVDAWRQADPELSSYVAEAREGLARLTGEPH